MQLRPYQGEAVAALDHHWATRTDNAVLVLPTGSGKTIVLAELIRRYLTQWPGTRICVLVHVRELVRQNASKLAEHWPQAPLGVYSASLGARDTHAPVIFASIQSVYKRADELGRFDLVFIDEAHRVPLTGDGQYRRFIADATALNPRLRVMGLTATPYRLGRGLVYGPDYILNCVAYEAPVRRLIEQGYLCRLTSKATSAKASGEGVTVRAGEYVARELEERVNTDDVVDSAVEEMVHRLSDRQAWIVFCAGVDHAYHVSEVLSEYGIKAPVIHAKTPARERERTIAQFNAGRLRALCNVNVLSEGFDAPHVDAVVLLRPTKSAGLYYQQVGRGFRLHPGKTDCLVLDFAGNVREHGPVDLIRVRDKRKRGESVTEAAPTKECPGRDGQCKSIVHLSCMQCPECGHKWPEPEVKHEARPDDTPVLSEPARRAKVVGVTYARHVGPSGIPTLRVDYALGRNRVSEWICLEHNGYAGAKAASWWQWCAEEDEVPCVFDALDHIRTYGIREPNYVHVDSTGKYPRIVKYEWHDHHHDQTVDAEPQSAVDR